ncbi:hypothetical protein SAMD00079811_83000 (plasmid) [Scytonema sp. HK-05]|uniref:DUF4365 domain-containing protein n=1 Tax=Nostocales TaxID=1161 RepID=UPI00031A3BBD|nr:MULTISPECIES: DUF4365 domain-containing protein [Nostocales]BAY50669.1 hypothetical protein SAMD00079811_83000 [Scytonema sp. HK-05]
MFPKVSDNYFTERQGVLAVSMHLNNIGFIFRETPNADVGIDGQIEYVSNGEAPGRLAAAQIKSGASYLRDKGDHWAFYPDPKHKVYWECFPLPVYLFLHDPQSGLTYYTDARYYLNIPERDREYTYIPVLKANRLDMVSSEELMTSVGPVSSNLLEYPELLKTMVRGHSGNASFPLTYLDLFCNGLTNLCRHIYFGMSLATDLADIYLEIDQSEFGLGVGSYEHDFLHSYTRFLISQNLARIDYSDYLIDWFEREMQPQYIAPLTSRGRGLVEYIRQVEQKLFETSDLVSVACERPMRMLFGLPSDIVRIPNIKEFGKRVLLISDTEDEEHQNK